MREAVEGHKALWTELPQQESISRYNRRRFEIPPLPALEIEVRAYLTVTPSRGEKHALIDCKPNLNRLPPAYAESPLTETPVSRTSRLSLG